MNKFYFKKKKNKVKKENNFGKLNYYNLSVNENLLKLIISDDNEEILKFHFINKIEIIDFILEFDFKIWTNKYDLNIKLYWIYKIKEWKIVTEEEFQSLLDKLMLI